MTRRACSAKATLSERALNQARIGTEIGLQISEEMKGAQGLNSLSCSFDLVHLLYRHWIEKSTHRIGFGFFQGRLRALGQMFAFPRSNALFHRWDLYLHQSTRTSCASCGRAHQHRASSVDGSNASPEGLWRSFPKEVIVEMKELDRYEIPRPTWWSLICTPSGDSQGRSK